jgi:hypothetical protein
VWKLEGKISLGRTGHKWEDNIKINLKDIVWEVVDWINRTQDRNRWWDVANTAMDI